jgi:FKBP-type peptidyl-prolyl cis-trans isomerase
MSNTITTGIVVALALAVLVLFFIFNPFAVQNSLSNPTGSNIPTDTGNASQLVVQDEVVGSGAAAQAGDTLTVDYTGKLQNGTVFDTSIGKTPIMFVLGAGHVIAGWDQGLVGMKEGGKRILIIPPSLGYGVQGMGPIPANSTLMFEVELLKVTPSSNVAPVPEGAAAQ